MLGEHITTVECSDDPTVHQAPPAAPLDTLIGVGTGRYNGVDGYTIEFTLQDYGEPGSNDKMAIKIYQTANPANVFAQCPLQTMTGREPQNPLRPTAQVDRISVHRRAQPRPAGERQTEFGR